MAGARHRCVRRSGACCASLLAAALDRRRTAPVVRPALLGAFVHTASVARARTPRVLRLARRPEPGALSPIAIRARRCWSHGSSPVGVRRSGSRRSCRRDASRPACYGGTLLLGAALGILAAGAATVTRDWWGRSAAPPCGPATPPARARSRRRRGSSTSSSARRRSSLNHALLLELRGIGLMCVFSRRTCGSSAKAHFARPRLPHRNGLAPQCRPHRDPKLLIGRAGHEDVAMGGFTTTRALLFCATALGIGTGQRPRAFGTVQARSEPARIPPRLYCRSWRSSRPRS